MIQWAWQCKLAPGPRCRHQHRSREFRDGCQEGARIVAAQQAVVLPRQPSADSPKNGKRRRAVGHPRESSDQAWARAALLPYRSTPAAPGDGVRGADRGCAAPVDAGGGYGLQLVALR